MSVRVGSEHRSRFDDPEEGRRALRQSWIWLGMLPVHFVLATLLGDWLISIQGYQSGTEELLPLSVVALAGIPAVLVMIAPTIPAARLARKAIAMGEPNGRTPAVIAITVAVAGVLLNLAALILGRLS